MLIISPSCGAPQGSVLIPILFTRNLPPLGKTVGVPKADTPSSFITDLKKCSSLIKLIVWNGSGKPGPIPGIGLDCQGTSHDALSYMDSYPLMPVTKSVSSDPEFLCSLLFLLLLVTVVLS